MKTETSRHEFLARVRSRLGAAPASRLRAEPSAAPVSHPLRVSWGRSQDDLIAQFTAVLEQTGGHVYRVADADAAHEQLVKILRQSHARGAPRIVYADVPSLGDLARGILVDAFQAVNVMDLGNALRDTLAQTDVGITDADYAIAETGTLLLRARPGRPRLLTALPAIHIAVVRTEQVVPTFADLVPVARNMAIEASHMTLITGPSRTGDIEQVITIGAHGPRELHVILREA